MWIKTAEQKPKLFLETVFFGKVCIGTELEKKSRFSGYPTETGIIDDYGDSIDGVEAEYWWDWDQAENPE